MSRVEETIKTGTLDVNFGTRALEDRTVASAVIRILFSRLCPLDTCNPLEIELEGVYNASYTYGTGETLEGCLDTFVGTRTKHRSTSSMLIDRDDNVVGTYHSTQWSSIWTVQVCHKCTKSAPLNRTTNTVKDRCGSSS